MVQHSPPTHQVPELSSLLHLSFCIMDIFVSVPSIIGGFVEGAAISNILFGITISQFYVYTQNWNRDPKWLKWLATGVMLLEVVYTVFSQRAQYYYSVLSVQDPVVILESDWSVPAILVLQILTEVAVRGFYIYRVWTFSRNLTLLIGMTTLLTTFSGLFLTGLVYIFRVGTMAAATNLIFKSVMIATCSVVMCTDVFIAATMVYYLYHTGRKSQFKRTQGILGWLILYFVSSGVMLVAFSGSVLICFTTNGNNLVWGGITILYARALSNSFFGALNIRKLLRSKQGQMITFNGVSLPQSTVPTSLELHQVQVQVSRDTMINTDSNPTLGNESSDNKCTNVLAPCNA